MPIKTCPQAFLIQEMCDQANTPTQYKQPIKDTHVQVILGFFRREGATVAEQINEADCHTAVYIEDEVVFLGSRNGLNSDSIIQKFCAGEVFVHEVFDKLDTKIRVLTRLDTMTNTGN